MKTNEDEKKRNNRIDCNFLVSIRFTDNYSFQGVIEWLDTGKKIHFRSELEMISLMLDAAQANQVGNNELRRWTDLKNIKSV